MSEANAGYEEIVIVTEKYNVAKFFSDTLLQNCRKKGNGFSGTLHGKSCFVTFTQGHLYTLKLPDQIDPKFKDWDLDHLPFVAPTEFCVCEGKDGLQKQINTQIKNCKLLVLASDPDPQGVYLADLVRLHSGYKGPIKRSGIKTFDPERLKEQFASFSGLDEYAQYLPIAASECCRNTSDYKLGINLSRLFSILAQSKQAIKSKPLVVGRIQSTILGIVCRRQLAIQNFKPEPFFNIKVDATRTIDGSKIQFQLVHDRIFDVNIRDQLISDLENGQFEIVEIESKETVKSPLCPHKQSTLQIELGQKFNYSPIEVLDAAKANYEEGYQSYPRTDDNKIEYAEWKRAKRTLGRLIGDVGISEDLLDYGKSTSYVLAEGAINESAHTAILPTGKVWDKSKSGIRWHVFEEVTKRFAMQFMADHHYESTLIIAKIGKNRLEAKGKTVTQIGWKEFAADDIADKEKPLPNISKDDLFSVRAYHSKSTTKAPNRLQEFEVIEALENIDKHIPESHANLAQYFSQSDVAGIGSPATRAPSLQKTIDHGSIRVIDEGKKKFVVPTKSGMSFFEALPEEITNVTLFCEWERDFTLVMNRQKSMRDVVNSHSSYVDGLVHKFKGNPDIFNYKPPIKITGYECQECSSQLAQQTYKDRKYWKCQLCGATLQDNKNEPQYPLEEDGSACTKEVNGTACKGVLKTFVGNKKQSKDTFVTLKCNKCHQFTFPRNK